jgi:hypothetical protein
VPDRERPHPAHSRPARDLASCSKRSNRVASISAGAAQDVPARPALETLRPKGSAQVGDVALKRAPRRRGRVFAPDPVDQLLERNEAVRPEEQVHEHGALLGASEGQRSVPVDHLESSQNPEVHLATLILAAVPMEWACLNIYKPFSSVDWSPSLHVRQRSHRKGEAMSILKRALVFALVIGAVSEGCFD